MNAQNLVERIHAVSDKYQGAIHNGMEAKDDASRQKLESAYTQMHEEYRALASEFLAQHDVPLSEGQMIEVFPHLLMDEGRRKTASLVVANRKYDGTNSVDCYTNATWFDVDPVKSAMDVTHLPEEWEHNKQGRIVEQKPAIPYRN